MRAEPETESLRLESSLHFVLPGASPITRQHGLLRIALRAEGALPHILRVAHAAPPRVLQKTPNACRFRHRPPRAPFAGRAQPLHMGRCRHKSPCCRSSRAPLFLKKTLPHAASSFRRAYSYPKRPLRAALVALLCLRVVARVAPAHQHNNREFFSDFIVHTSLITRPPWFRGWRLMKMQPVRTKPTAANIEANGLMDQTTATMTGRFVCK